MPAYLRDTLPNPNKRPAAGLVANLPESSDRPGVEKLDKMIGFLY